MELEGRNFKGNRTYVYRDRQAVFQIHRWIETTPNRNDSSSPYIVGEWSVAERPGLPRRIRGPAGPRRDPHLAL